MARATFDIVSGEGQERLSALQALKLLERFLDLDLDAFDRSCALDDPRIADGLVVQFLATLPVEARLEALAVCDRPAVLAHWVTSQIVEDRHAVACNVSTTRELQLQLSDDADPTVRAALVDNLRLDFDVLVSLLADSSVLVQEALAAHFAFWRDEDPLDEADDEAGSDESLTYLYEMVPAVEADECLDAWERHKHQLEIAALIRETQHADWAAFEGDLDDRDLEPEPEEPTGDAGLPRPTFAQALGLVRQLLGAEEV